MEYKNRIRILREEKGYTQKNLARLLNVTPACLSKYEKGVHEIPVSVMICAADIFDVSVDYLIGRTSTRLSCEKVSGSFTKKATLGEFAENSMKLDSRSREILYDVMSAFLLKRNIEEASRKK